METLTKQRWIYLDACKIFAMFFIIVMHVSAGSWSIISPYTFEWQVLNTFNSASRFCIALFIMQMGALLLNEEKDISLSILFKNYVLRIVCAFFFWSVVNMLVFYRLESPGGFSDFKVSDFIIGVLRGHQYRHWFIFVIISLYLSIPMLRTIVKNSVACRYFLILWGLFALCVPMFYQIPVIFQQLPPSINTIMTQIAEMSYRIRPQMVLEFTGYFILGHYIHTYSFTRKQVNWLVGIGAAALLYTILLTRYVSMRDGTPNEAFYGNITLNIALIATAVMLLFKTGLDKKWFSDATYKSLLFFSDVSFGVFLIHDFIRTAFIQVGIDTLTWNPIISVPLISIALYVISGGISFLINKIPKFGKYII